MPCRRHRTLYPISSQYRGRADLLCYPLMWNVTLEYTATKSNVLGKTQPRNPSPILHTHTPANAQLYDTVMVVASGNLGRKYRTKRILWCANPTLSARPQLLPMAFLFLSGIQRTPPVQGKALTWRHPSANDSPFHRREP